MHAPVRLVHCSLAVIDCECLNRRNFVFGRVPWPYGVLYRERVLDRGRLSRALWGPRFSSTCAAYESARRTVKGAGIGVTAALHRGSSGREAGPFENPTLHRRQRQNPLAELPSFPPRRRPARDPRAVAGCPESRLLVVRFAARADGSTVVELRHALYTRTQHSLWSAWPEIGSARVGRRAASDVPRPFAARPKAQWPKPCCSPTTSG